MRDAAAENRIKLRATLPEVAREALNDIEEAVADAEDMLKGRVLTDNQYRAFQALVLDTVYPTRAGKLDPTITATTAKLAEMLDRTLQSRAGLLAGMAAAFIAQVGCAPDEVELVEQINSEEVAYFFRTRPKQEKRV